MNLTLRAAAKPEDHNAIASLIAELAASTGETTPITAEYVRQYLEFPGSNILVAILDKQVVGLLSFSLRPNLYHAGNSCTIEELIVAQPFRNRGIGGALLEEFLRQLSEQDCVEVSVTTMPDNHGAIAFYKSHGLIDEAIYLEKHFRE
jgi:ribosomal protein S18 acetylase RimI-like enzyme